MTDTYTTNPRVVGEMVDVVCANADSVTAALTTWTEVTVEQSVEKYDCPAAASPVNQFAVGRGKLTFSLKGYVGNGESMPELPVPGGIVKSFAIETVTEGANLLPDLTDFGDLVVLKVNYSQKDAPGTWSVDGEASGFVSS